MFRSLSRWGNAGITPVIDLLCPPTCWAVPESTCAALGGLAYETRLRLAKLAAQNYCLHCGLTIGPHELHDARDPCGRCGQREVGVVRMARVGTFTEPLVTLVHRLKFGKSWEIARILAPFVYQSMVRASETCKITVDAMVPIPLHWSRRIARGFNQAQEIAHEVRSLSRWPMVVALRRIRRTDEQARIDTPTQRTENMRGAFAAIADPGVAGRHVWLIDDVSTTGATLHAAASALRRLPREFRPASINAAVLCVADAHSAPPT